MSTTAKWILGLVIAIIVILIYFNWSRIQSWFGSFPKSKPAEGAACSSTGSSAIDGKIINGVCVKSQIPQRPTIPAVGLKLDIESDQQAYDLDANGCLVEKNPKVMVPNSTITPILEVKKSASNCSIFKNMMFIRTSFGWFPYSTYEFSLKN